jgi:ribosomal protein S18 acetylase RimI-like enzyme
MESFGSNSTEKSEMGSESGLEVKPSSGSSNANDVTQIRELTINDFLPKPTVANKTIKELNDFFNSPQIKQELHWFTHRDTLERAFERDDRELFHIRPQNCIAAASMVWCESRVLEEQQAQIRLIATRPDYRGHGLARMLVDECISFAQFQNQTEMIADVAQEGPATQFWKECNFGVKTIYETDGGRSMLRMSREI